MAFVKAIIESESYTGGGSGSGDRRGTRDRSQRSAHDRRGDSARRDEIDRREF